MDPTEHSSLSIVVEPNFPWEGKVVAVDRIKREITGGNPADEADRE